MKKRDLKKLALMGITGGLLLGSQCSLKAETEADSSFKIDQTLAMKNGCGGPGGCGGKTNCNGNGNGKNNNKMMHGNGNGNMNGNGNNHCNGNGNGNNHCNGNRKNGNMNRKQQISMSGGNLTNEKAMTEDDLMSKLTPQMKAVYQNMSPEGKALVLDMANSSPQMDPNTAVKEAAEKMMEKRKKLHSN